jgi:hypothetical protein
MATLLSYLTALSGLIGYIFSGHFKLNNTILTYTVVCLLAIYSIYVFTLLFALVLPKNQQFKGSPPKEILYKGVFEGLTTEEGVKILMCNEVERIQDKIERVHVLNKKRSGQYRSALKISLIYIAITIFTLVKMLFYL